MYSLLVCESGAADGVVEGKMACGCELRVVPMLIIVQAALGNVNTRPCTLYVVACDGWGGSAVAVARWWIRGCCASIVDCSRIPSVSLGESRRGGFRCVSY